MSASTILRIEGRTVVYDGLICHITHAKPQGQGIDECAVYGDFFYLEALARYLVPGFKKYW